MTRTKETMLDAIYKVITAPAAFFRGLATNPRRAGAAFWVVLLVIAVSAVAGYFGVLPQLDAFGSDSPFASFAVIGAVVGVVVATFLQWLVYGLLVRMAAGMRAQPWAVVGYAMAPYILVGALTIVLAALFPVEVTPILASPQDPDAFREALAAFNEEYHASFFAVAGTVLGYGGAAWWLLLVFVGVRETTGRMDLAMRSAVLATTLYLALIVVPWLLAPLPT
ncbi:MAG TPA: YIP1 family protein [Trueperaceae bacterium]